MRNVVSDTQLPKLKKVAPAFRCSRSSGGRCTVSQLYSTEWWVLGQWNRKGAKGIWRWSSKSKGHRSLPGRNDHWAEFWRILGGSQREMVENHVEAESWSLWWHEAWKRLDQELYIGLYDWHGENNNNYYLFNFYMSNITNIISYNLCNNH